MSLVIDSIRLKLEDAIEYFKDLSPKLDRSIRQDFDMYVDDLRDARLSFNRLSKCKTSAEAIKSYVFDGSTSFAASPGLHGCIMQLIFRTLEKNKWNRTATSIELDISPRTVHNYVHKLRANGIDVPKWIKPTLRRNEPGTPGVDS